MRYGFNEEGLMIPGTLFAGEIVGDADGRYRSRDWVKTALPLLLAVLGISCFLVVGCGNGSSKDTVEQLHGKIEQLEGQVTQLETGSATLKKTVSDLVADVQALSEKSAALSQQVNELTAKTAMTSSRKESAFIGEGAGQYHTVERGETLYAIAKKFDLSVSELCQLNNLKKDQTIRAGQKLLVAPGF